MADALRQVKRALGKDAVILHTRTFTSGGLFGLGGRPVVEITATADTSDLPQRKGQGTVAPRSGRRKVQADGAVSPMTTMAAVQSGTGVSELAAEVTALKSMVQDLVSETRRTRAPSLPDDLFQTYLTLIEREVSEELAQQLVSRLRNDLGEQRLSDPSAVRAQLETYLGNMVPVGGPIQLHTLPKPAVIALVGPTGVGKTTTVAKLAANFRLRENKKVGLITVDTYRIAAVEQLRTYAQIINVPLEVVMSPSQVRAAMDRLKDCDVILIDTVGRSPNDEIHMNELKCHLDQAKPDEVHLVLSSTVGQTVLDRILASYGALGVDRVIFTKLDEAVGFGVILSCLQKAGARLSYLTTGQDVPDDIEVGQGSRVAQMILGAKATGEGIAAQ